MIVVKAVAGILRRDNKILVAERPAGKPYSGFWEFPGGKIEAQESADSALIRELHEELGIEVSTATFLFHHEYTYPDKIVDLQIFEVREFYGEPEGRENQALCWASLAEMRGMKLLEGNWVIVDKLNLFPSSR
jgi:8-oxo-dGTP diphosphatase